MDEQELKDWKKAGQIVAGAREYARSLVKVGVPLIEVADKTEEKISALGGKPAFPAQISLNHIAAHYCSPPHDETLFKDGDVAKIDIGVHVNGCVGDTATTVDLGDHRELIEASKEALKNALALVRPGTTLGEIGREIQKTITSYNLAPIKNLCGHGVGKYIVHCPPSIPNYDTGEKTTLKEGQTIAIEPFASTGAGMIYEERNTEIFQIVGKRPVRNPSTRYILQKIEAYEGLPFTTRWLTKEFPAFKVNIALRELMQQGIIRGFPPLPDKAKGLVSQAEHTVLVQEKPLILTKLSE
ncbi:type II methionyl aminopeptidase, partial [Candidatus Woesearchaeota archaeon]|nr:type II methionyl aminopeptidase [Candidatus Woesearchaeota archaeon]